MFIIKNNKFKFNSILKKKKYIYNKPVNFLLKNKLKRLNIKYLKQKVEKIQKIKYLKQKLKKRINFLKKKLDKFNKRNNFINFNKNKFNNFNKNKFNNFNNNRFILWKQNQNFFKKLKYTTLYKIQYRFKPNKFKNFLRKRYTYNKRKYLFIKKKKYCFFKKNKNIVLYKMLNRNLININNINYLFFMQNNLLNIKKLNVKNKNNILNKNFFSNYFSFFIKKNYNKSQLNYKFKMEKKKKWSRYKFKVKFIRLFWKLKHFFLKKFPTKINKNLFLKKQIKNYIKNIYLIKIKTPHSIKNLKFLTKKKKRLLEKKKKWKQQWKKKFFILIAKRKKKLKSFKFKYKSFMGYFKKRRLLINKLKKDKTILKSSLVNLLRNRTLKSNLALNSLKQIILFKNIYLKYKKKNFLKKKKRFKLKKNYKVKWWILPKKKKLFLFKKYDLHLKNKKNYFLLKNKIKQSKINTSINTNLLIFLNFYKQKWQKYRLSHNEKKKSKKFLNNKKYNINKIFKNNKYNKKLSYHERNILFKKKLYLKKQKKKLKQKEKKFLIFNLIKILVRNKLKKKIYIFLKQIMKKWLNLYLFRVNKMYEPKKLSLYNLKYLKKKKLISNTFEKINYVKTEFIKLPVRKKKITYNRFKNNYRNIKLNKNPFIKKKDILIRTFVYKKKYKKQKIQEKKLFPQSVKKRIKTQHVRSMLRYYWRNKHRKAEKGFFVKKKTNSYITPFWHLLTNNIIFFKNEKITVFARDKLKELKLSKGVMGKMQFIYSKKFYLNVRKRSRVIISLNKKKKLRKKAIINLFFNNLVPQEIFAPFISFIKNNKYKKKNTFIILISNPLTNTFFYLNIKKINKILLIFKDINQPLNFNKKKKTYFLKKFRRYKKFNSKKEILFFFIPYGLNILLEKKNTFQTFRKFLPISKYIYKKKSNLKFNKLKKFKKKLKKYRELFIKKKLKSKAFKYYYRFSKRNQKLLKKKKLFKLTKRKNLIYNFLIKKNKKKNYNNSKYVNNINIFQFFLKNNTFSKNLKLKNFDQTLFKFKKAYIDYSKKIQFFNKSEENEFKWKFFDRRWHFNYSRWKQSLTFKRILNKAWSKYRKLKYNIIFLNLYKVHLYLIYGINEIQLWNIWSKIRKGNNKEASNIIQLQQAFSLKLDSLCLLFGLTPNRLIANEFIKAGGFRINGLVITNSNFILALNDVLQLDLDLNNHIQSLHNKVYWNKIKSRINFIPYFQVMWSLMLISLIRWPYKYELVEESILTERWLRFYLRYLPCKKSKFKKSQIKWLKY